MKTRGEKTSQIEMTISFLLACVFPFIADKLITSSMGNYER